MTSRKCPVCQQELKLNTDEYNGIIMAEEAWCGCGYTYEFSFGSSRDCYGPFEVVNHWTRQSRWQQKLNRLQHKVYCTIWKFITFDGIIRRKL